MTREQDSMTRIIKQVREVYQLKGSKPLDLRELLQQVNKTAIV